MAESEEAILDLYVSDDGEVRFPDVEGWDSAFVEEPMLPDDGGPAYTFPPDAQNLRELAEGMHMRLGWRRYRRVRYHCGSVECREWIGQNPERARALILACQINEIQ